MHSTSSKISTTDIHYFFLILLFKFLEERNQNPSLTLNIIIHLFKTSLYLGISIFHKMNQSLMR